MSKKTKAIKRLNDRVKKLNKRINKLDKQLEGLQSEPELEVAAEPVTSFSVEEVEAAHEITDEAEAVLDILEKEDELSERKVSSGSKPGKKNKKKLRKKSKK